MSRKPHAPTDETRKTVKSLSATGLTQDDIAIILGISEKTLRLYYRAELDEGLAEANAVVVEALHTAIRNDNLAAIIFFEKCRGGRRIKVKEQVAERVEEEIIERLADLPGPGIVPGCELKKCVINKARSIRFKFKVHSAPASYKLDLDEVDRELARVMELIAREEKRHGQK